MTTATTITRPERERGRARGAAAGTGPLAAARAIAPEITARGREIEHARTLPADLVAQLRQAGLLRIARPASLGGSGATPRELVETIEELSRADGATGWSVLIANIGSALLAWLDHTAAAEMVGAEPELVIAGGQAPLGEGERLGGSYRITGRWPFASGCLHATWFIGGFQVRSGGAPVFDDQGVPESRVAHFPASLARIEDTWHVAGLAGTGSHDIVAEQMEVPVNHTSVPYYGQADYPDPLFRLTGYNLLLTLLSGFPLGVARRALDEVTHQLAEQPAGAGEGGGLADPQVQVSLLHHETAWRAARCHVLDTLDELLAELATGDVGYPGRARLAAAIIHACDVSRGVAQECFRLAGPEAVPEANPLQRCMRDLVAGSQHLSFSRDARRKVAKALLGRQTGPVFFGV